MEQNLYHLTAEQRKERGIVALPETLGEAIDELAGSDLARQRARPLTSSTATSSSSARSGTTTASSSPRGRWRSTWASCRPLRR